MLWHCWLGIRKGKHSHPACKKLPLQLSHSAKGLLRVLWSQWLAMVKWLCVDGLGGRGVKQVQVVKLTSQKHRPRRPRQLVNALMWHQRPLLAWWIIKHNILCQCYVKHSFSIISLHLQYCCLSVHFSLKSSVSISARKSSLLHMSRCSDVGYIFAFSLIWTSLPQLKLIHVTNRMRLVDVGAHHIHMLLLDLTWHYEICEEQFTIFTCWFLC